MRRRKTEYEVCEVDEHGDIQNIEYFTSLSSARDYKNKLTSQWHTVEIWKTVWSFVNVCEWESDTNKDSQEKIE